MKASVVGSIIAVIVIVGGAITLAATHHKSPNKNSSATTNTSKAVGSNNNTTPKPASNDNAGSTSSGSTTPSATESVMINNFAFSPATITVAKGTTVTWMNMDSVAHTVQETDGQTGPKSSDLDTGKSYSFTYNTAGTFKYHCSIHPDMTGTVTVTD